MKSAARKDDDSNNSNGYPGAKRRRYAPTTLYLDGEPVTLYASLEGALGQAWRRSRDRGGEPFMVSLAPRELSGAAYRERRFLVTELGRVSSEAVPLASVSCAEAVIGNPSLLES